MDIEKYLVERIERHLEVLFEGERTRNDVSAVAATYVRDVYHIDEPANLLAIELTDGAFSRMIRFDVLAAAGFVASLVSGVAGAGNPILLGCAVLASVGALGGVVEKTSKAEGLLFWAIYGMEGHQGTRQEIEVTFRSLCSGNSEVVVDDFSAALQGLIDIGVIEQQDGQLRVAERLVFVWFRE